MDKTAQQPNFDMIMSINPVSDRMARQGVTDWRKGLPAFSGSQVVLRDLHPADAPSLLVSLTSAEVSRFISPPPATLEGFERFVAWAHRERTLGRYVCFAMVPAGSESAAGVFQLRSLDLEFGTCEWGFALASEYWGSGMFSEAAAFVIEFAFTVVGAYRLEARAAIRNGRGNGALKKLDRKSTRLNSSHIQKSRMPSSA